jgi:hypothetical protein
MGVLIINTQLVAGQSCIDWGHGMPYHCCVSVARRQLIITRLRLLRVSSSIKIVQLCFISSCSNNHQGALLTMLNTRMHTHKRTHPRTQSARSASQISVFATNNIFLQPTTSPRFQHIPTNQYKAVILQMLSISQYPLIKVSSPIYNTHHYY